MFIFIWEDGTITQGHEVLEDHVKAADDGILDIIDISKPYKPLVYWNAVWDEIDKC